MKIVVLFNAHENTELVTDTVQAIRAWATDNILMIVDGAFWEQWGSTVDVSAEKMCGFIHGQSRSPYKNVAFGLMMARNKWPDADWYCYIEPDTLFCSHKFKEDLLSAEKNGAWMVGTNLRHGNFKFPFLEHMLKIKFKCSKYLLGCCTFFHKQFMEKLDKINFFEKFLFWTNEFAPPYFPGYEEQNGYDLSEHLYPTLANYYGGKIVSLSSWSDVFEGWQSGNFKRYPIRWRPEIADDYFYSEVSIAHPVKELFHPYRVINRGYRNG